MRREEVRPFLEEVTRGTRVPEERLQEVARHYDAVGGRSPYNDHTLRLFGRLEERLRGCGVSLPLFLGMRNWHPFLRDTMAAIRHRELCHGLGVILAPHRCEASFEKYLRSVEAAKARASAPSIRYEYLPPWHEHPGFIEAQADQVRRVLLKRSAVEREETHLLFSAHSIPMDMAQRCSYAQEVQASAREVAGCLQRGSWSVAYQSRSGSPAQPWLEPDVRQAMAALKRDGRRHVTVVPVGFLCDNVEVLFDLDLEAREEAQRLGLGFARASTVMDHPAFVSMLAELLVASLQLGAPLKTAEATG